MEVGISTASLFLRYNNEDAFAPLKYCGANLCEVFLTSFCEYNKEFGKLLKERKGDIKVHSIHTVSTNFEPQLYAKHPKLISDCFSFLSSAMECAREVGAKHYTFHGMARVKKAPLKMDFDFIGERTQQIIDTLKKYDVTLTYENVHWAYYNYIGFFKTLKNLCPELKGVLDVKQARESGIDYFEFLKEMGSDIATVHVSGVDENGKIVLPKKNGVFDFELLVKRLMDVGCDAPMFIEVYKDSYSTLDELKNSVEYLREIVYKLS